MIRFGLYLDKLISYRAFVGFHVRTLHRIHKLIIYKHATRLEGGLVLIRIVRIGIRRVHC